ncbi:MAG: ribosome assembly factor SBDS [Infirmifilum sp.]|jgi:ribosome maturation protein SDO1|uniref:RNA-associated protein n=1 Tax=Infirmifilum uzonense TaxID=1550241 RepID=A0A0F7FIR2_9CREN|nr:ribosome assembly factor SBDS [Infirmifilum uzonense]AKG39148.1 RNA-associated protein [Infirmifilum uzonense]
MSKKKLSIARLEKGGKRFEVFVDAEKAWAMKNGEKVNIREIIEGEFIYSDAKQGLKASETDLKKFFGTTDPYVIAENIIKKGELLLTAEQRRELIEAKRRQIIEFLSRNTIDPRTNTPIPPKRIELALEEAKVSIDPFKPVEAQVNDILKSLKMILPLKVARAILAVHIPAPYVGKAYGALQKIGKVLRESYATDGSLNVELEVPAGMQSSVIETVSSLTKGQGDVKLLRTEQV